MSLVMFRFKSTFALVSVTKITVRALSFNCDDSVVYVSAKYHDIISFQIGLQHIINLFLLVECSVCKPLIVYSLINVMMCGRVYLFILLIVMEFYTNVCQFMYFMVWLLIVSCRSLSLKLPVLLYISNRVNKLKKRMT